MQYSGSMTFWDGSGSLDPYPILDYEFESCSFHVSGSVAFEIKKSSKCGSIRIRNTVSIKGFFYCVNYWLEVLTILLLIFRIAEFWSRSETFWKSRFGMGIVRKISDPTGFGSGVAKLTFLPQKVYFQQCCGSVLNPNPDPAFYVL